MIEVMTLPEEWLRELSEEDRARIMAEVEQTTFDPYEDDQDEYK